MALVQEPTAGIVPKRIARFGWRPDPPDPRDRIYNLEEKVALGSALPGQVDLTKQMPAIYDQGQLGSCTAQGIARCLEYQAILQGQPAMIPSRLFIYYNERVIEGTVNEDAGASIRDGIKVVVKQGAPPESDWPYSDANPRPFQKKPSAKAYSDALKEKALTYKRIVLGGPGAPVRSAIANKLPVVFGFSVPESFEDGSWDPAKSPLPVPASNQTFIGGHCVVISGYDFTRTRFPHPALLIENSWGTGWGMKGRFWMDYHWFDANAGLVADLWVIQTVM